MSGQVTAKCAIISTGGTIVSYVDPITGLAKPKANGSGLFEGISGLEALAQVEAAEPFCVASPQILPDVHWPLLRDAIRRQVERTDVTCVVVAHGTALMEETAWFLDLTIDTRKPVILTGAQRHASDPYTDGPFNVLNAVRVGVHPDAVGLGVLIVMNQRIHTARDATKYHTFDLNAFDSGEHAAIGLVAPSGVEIYRRPVLKPHVSWNGSVLPTVAILPMYAGANADLVHAAAACYEGIVIQGVGAGHVNESMYHAICHVIEKGRTVVVTTRVSRGGARPCYGFTGSSQQLEDAGAIIAAGLSGWKARVFLMLALASKTCPHEAFSKVNLGAY